MSQNTEWSLQGKKPRWSNQNSCCSRLTSDLRNQHSCDTIKSLPQPTSQFFLYTMIQFCCQNSLIFLRFFPSLPPFCLSFFLPSLLSFLSFDMCSGGCSNSYTEAERNKTGNTDGKAIFCSIPCAHNLIIYYTKCVGTISKSEWGGMRL